MRTRPLVSVLMPAYNAEATIERAIQSVISQTHEHLECIVVDDGSTDATVDYVKKIGDNRVVLQRLDKNYGRGVARQKALELAHGKYVTMVDADDWIYPEKLAIQVAFLESNPDCALHTCGMAVISEDNELLAVRRSSYKGSYQFDVLRTIPVFHAPSMFRRSLTNGVLYDERFLLAQDMDFLRRLLWGRKFFVSDEILYAYDEVQSVSVKKLLRAYAFNAKGYLKFIKYDPVRSVSLSLREILKIFYVLAKVGVVGRKSLLLSRSSPPNFQDIESFVNARSVMFPDPGKGSTLFWEQ